MDSWTHGPKLTPPTMIPPTDSGAAAPGTTDFGVRRVRHPMQRRRISVLRIAETHPHMRCIAFGGADLHDFVSASFDDHAKLFIPLPGSTQPPMPPGAPGGSGRPERDPSDGPRPVARDHTPRRHDAAAEAGEVAALRQVLVGRWAWPSTRYARPATASAARCRSLRSSRGDWRGRRRVAAGGGWQPVAGIFRRPGRPIRPSIPPSARP